MPPISPTSLHPRASYSTNTTASVGLQVVCAWPVSGQYGPGSRVLYYVLIAACVFARKADWIRNACLAAALLFPAVAALHGITLAVLHVDGAVDMDVYGAFQLCSLGILAAPVTARMSRTYFDDPGRNIIFLWTVLILAGLLSLVVEFFRTQTKPCLYDGSDTPTPLNVGNFSYNITCGLSCSVEEGPFSPLRLDAANNIYVIPAPDKLTFNTVTLFAAACCIPAILSLISMWNKILEINWATRFGNKIENDMHQAIEGTNGATIGRMKVINTWLRTLLTAVEAPIFGAAVMAILVMGERNFFSPQVRYQTEPIASIGQWAPIVGTGLAIVGSLYVALAKVLKSEGESPKSTHASDGSEGASVSSRSVQNSGSPEGRVLNNGERSSSEFIERLRPSPSNDNNHSIQRGSRHKVARTLLTIANYLGTAGEERFDDSGFRRGRANDFPEIPGEENRNKKLGEIRERYNLDRDEDGHLTPVTSRGLSRSNSRDSRLSRSRISRTPSPRRARPEMSMVRQESLEVQDPSPSSLDPAGSRHDTQRNMLEVPSPAHLKSSNEYRANEEGSE